MPELLDRGTELKPADFARRIHEEQKVLIKLANDKADQLREATAKTATKLPDTRRGQRLREPSCLLDLTDILYMSHRNRARARCQEAPRARSDDRSGMLGSCPE